MQCSTRFQLYHGGQLYWWRKPKYLPGSLSHIVVSSTHHHEWDSNSNYNMITTMMALSPVYKYNQQIFMYWEGLINYLVSGSKEREVILLSPLPIFVKGDNLLFFLLLLFVCLVMFNATYNNISVISWRSVLLVEETGGPRENQRPVASHWQTSSHNVVHLALIEIRTHISGDRHWLHR